MFAQVSSRTHMHILAFINIQVHEWFNSSIPRSGICLCYSFMQLADIMLY